MADTLNRLQKNAGRRLVLISACADVFKAALVERADVEHGWRVAHVTAESDDLSRVLASLPVLSSVKHALLTTDACRILLLDQTIPDSLPNNQVREMLRWEVEALVTAENAENGRPASLPLSWETGHVRVAQQTAVAAQNPVLTAELQSKLSPHGITLLGVMPSLALGWALSGLQSSAVTEAVICQSGENCTLSVVERGKVEFFMTYALHGKGLPKNLIADARSFSIKKLHLLGDASLTEGVEESIPSLPKAEKNIDDWHWYAMLQSCGLLKSRVSPLSLPVVVTLDAPVAVWMRPVTWWAAAAAMIFLFVTPKLMEWRNQINVLEEQKAATMASIQETLEKLRVFATDAQAYDQLEMELKSLQAQIELALREAEKPGRAPCAQVGYVKDALSAVAQAFAARARVRHFKTDFHGRVYIQGESRGDAIVLDALEHFYQLLDHHPVKPAVVSTTKDGAAAGLLLFTADDDGSPLGTSLGVAPVAVASPTPTSPSTAPAMTAPSPEPAAPPVPSGLPVAQIPGMPPHAIPEGAPVMLNQ